MKYDASPNAMPPPLDPPFVGNGVPSVGDDADHVLQRFRSTTVNDEFALAHFPSEDVPLLDVDLIPDGLGDHGKVSLGDLGLAGHSWLEDADNESLPPLGRAVPMEGTARAGIG
jgi:hypothetical protein